MNAMLLREGIHNVQEGQEPGRLHGHPGDAAGNVKGALDRGLAHAVPFNDPLERANLESKCLVSEICFECGVAELKGVPRSEGGIRTIGYRNCQIYTRVS